jgi:hypothetical protein
MIGRLITPSRSRKTALLGIIAKTEIAAETAKMSESEPQIDANKQIGFAPIYPHSCFVEASWFFPLLLYRL